MDKKTNQNTKTHIVDVACPNEAALLNADNTFLEEFDLDEVEDLRIYKYYYGSTKKPVSTSRWGGLSFTSSSNDTSNQNNTDTKKTDSDNSQLNVVPNNIHKKDLEQNKGNVKKSDYNLRTVTKRRISVENYESIEINPKDFENDVFKNYLDENVANNKLSMINAKIQSPNLFTSSSSESIAKKSKDSQLNLTNALVLSDVKQQSQLSQLFNSSQVLNKIDADILNAEDLRQKQKVDLSSDTFRSLNSDENDLKTFKLPISSKRKSLEVPEGKPKIQKVNEFANKENVDLKKPDLISGSQLFESVHYRKEVSQMFEKLEKSICQFGNNRAILADKTNVDWEDDSFMVGSFLDELTQNDGLINDRIKQTLKENAKKFAQPQKLVNSTFVSGKATFQDLGPFFGLPSKVMDLITMYKGIERLYDWQHECLSLHAIKERKNLIYSLPTSGGKTLVAEVLILRELICRKRNVIFVLPYVAIVQEKVWALSPFAVALDFLIEEYAAGKGIYPPKKRRYKNSVYIATTEKALGLINSLIEEGRLEELGLVVVDELHLIGDEQRGATLEALLTKLMYLNEDIQIVGMSATIGNLQDIQNFLKAEVYTRNFRPIELTEYVKCGNQIAKINWGSNKEQVFEFVRNADFSYSSSISKIDPDHLGGLVMEVVPNGSCLIFCSSKQSCENVTKLLCKVVFPRLRTHKTKEKQQLLSAIKIEAGAVCSILEVSIPFGIAYHHSGLTSEERKLIEEAYRAGILSTICCTSTLAAGVNLPAKRVIIRKPYIAREFISLSRYKQMVGRAGRAGFGEVGESILISDKNDLVKFRQIVMAPMDQTLSKMHENECSSLSCISLGTANTKAQLEKVAAKTLLASQQEKLGVDMKVLLKKVITELFVLGAILTYKDFQKGSPSVSEVSVCINSSGSSTLESKLDTKKRKRRVFLQDDDRLVVSKLGTAAIKGCLELHKAQLLYNDLEKAQESVVLIDSLHLLYLVTPYNLVEQSKIEKRNLHNILDKLGTKEKKTASVLGISEACIVALFSNQDTKVLKKMGFDHQKFSTWKDLKEICLLLEESTVEI